MGTPHDGADVVRLASTIVRIASTVANVNTSNLYLIERGSEQLKGISRAFGFMNHLAIVTVLESNETLIPYTKTSKMVSGLERVNSKPEANRKRLCLNLQRDSMVETEKLFSASLGQITMGSASSKERAMENSERSGSLCRNLRRTEKVCHYLVPGSYRDFDQSVACSSKRIVRRTSTVKCIDRRQARLEPVIFQIFWHFCNIYRSLPTIPLFLRNEYSQI